MVVLAQPGVINMEMWLSQEDEEYLNKIVKNFENCKGDCTSCEAFEKINKTDCTFCELLLTYRSHVQCEITRLLDNM